MAITTLLAAVDRTAAYLDGMLADAVRAEGAERPHKRKKGDDPQRLHPRDPRRAQPVRELPPRKAVPVPPAHPVPPEGPEHTTHDYLTGTLERTKPLMPGKLPRIKYSELNKSWRGSCPFWSSYPPRS